VAALPLYSKLLHAVTGFTGTSTFSVPAGFTVVVRDIDVVVGIAAGITVVAYDGAGNTFWGVDTGVTTSTKTTFSWRGRQVIPGPDYFSITCDGACDFRSSGYLLSGVAP